MSNRTRNIGEYSSKSKTSTSRISQKKDEILSKTSSKTNLKDALSFKLSEKM